MSSGRGSTRLREWHADRRRVGSDERDEVLAEGRASHGGDAGVKRWSWPWVALLAVVALLGVSYSLATVAQPISADDTEHVMLDGTPIGLAPGGARTFTVDARQDGLSEIGVYFGTFKGTLSCTLDVAVSEGSQSLSDGTVPCASLGDNIVSIVARFPAVSDSADDAYQLRIAVTPDSLNGPVVWTSADGSPAIVTRYGSSVRVAAALSTVMERLDRYAPAWFGPGSGVALVVVIVVAAIACLVVRPRWALVALVVLALARGLLWSLLIPPLQGMDEPAHFASVQYIATQGQLPNPAHQGDGTPPYSPSLDVAAGAMGVSDQVPTDRPGYSAEAAADLEAADAAAGTAAGGWGPASGYPPGYYAPAALFYLAAPDDTVAQVHAVRLWSVLLGAAAAVFAWLFLGEAFRDRRVQSALALAFVLQPMVSHQSAIVNNDVWVIAAGAAVLWLGLRMVRTERPVVTMLWAGVAVGAGLLGKPLAAAFVIPVAVGWLVRVIRRGGWLRALGQAVAGGSVALVLYGAWWLVGRLTGIVTTTTFPPRANDMPTDLVTYLATQWDPKLREIASLWTLQFWGDFGWVNTPIPRWAWIGVQLVAAVCVLLAVAWLVMRPTVLRRRPALAELDVPIVVSGAFVGGSLVFLYAIEYAYFVASGRTDLLQGRYLLTAAAGVLALPPLLVGRVTGSPRAMRSAAWVVLAGVVLLQVVSVRQIALHYYL